MFIVGMEYIDLSDDKLTHIILQVVGAISLPSIG